MPARPLPAPLHRGFLLVCAPHPSEQKGLISVAEEARRGNLAVGLFFLSGLAVGDMYGYGVPREYATPRPKTEGCPLPVGAGCQPRCGMEAHNGMVAATWSVMDFVVCGPGYAHTYLHGSVAGRPFCVALGRDNVGTYIVGA